MATARDGGCFLRLEKHRTRSSLQVLALSPVVFGCQFDVFFFGVGHLMVFRKIRKDFD